MGELFIFVDECHRTQSGKLHRAMKALLPDAVFIGFTGTPAWKTRWCWIWCTKPVTSISG